ncbi:MAG: DMT family transporter [Chloroflexota bacterium]|nr:DMT family transporter [Chloroflexota bacterium]MDE2854769.1 DMT family transporter [Chloroflexota bacterium]MDE2946827.1 DMT family transporter [Chloroflexota bacterium]
MLDRRRMFIILMMIFSAAVTPVAIRITQGEGVPSLVIVLVRLWLVSVGLLPVIWLRFRAELFALTRRQALLSGFAGFWLALNLLLLFVSLEYTSVMMTSVLRRTTPMWIVLPEILIFGVVFSRRFWLSLALTLVGVTLVGFGGLSAIEAGSDPLLGGALALIGSFCFGAYILIGRQLNNVIPPLLYSFLVFFSAALVISVFVAASGTPVTGYSASGYLWILIVTILAQVIGHIFMNLSLQFFTATAMAIILQIAVVGSALIALFLFGEIPSAAQILGSALVIYGVIVASIERTGARWKQGPRG